MRRSGRRQRPVQAGLTIVELMIALPIILVAASMLVTTITASARQRQVNRENALVSQRVRAVLEGMRNEDFRDVYRLYNADPMDDPQGPGTAFGNRFDVPSLEPLDDSPDGLIGEVILPAIDVSTGPLPEWQLREDSLYDELGMPRDLNADNVVDDLDHSGDYMMLPVVVEARWQGRFGPRRFRVFTLLTEFRL